MANLNHNIRAFLTENVWKREETKTQAALLQKGNPREMQKIQIWFSEFQFKFPIQTQNEHSKWKFKNIMQVQNLLQKLKIWLDF